MPVLAQAFLAASLKTDAELLKWFRDRLVWNEPETVVDLLKNGLFVRLYEPQVRNGHYDTRSRHQCCGHGAKNDAWRDIWGCAGHHQGVHGGGRGHQQQGAGSVGRGAAPAGAGGHGLEPDWASRQHQNV